jgi:hypothetical protein
MEATEMATSQEQETIPEVDQMQTIAKYMVEKQE